MGKVSGSNSGTMEILEKIKDAYNKITKVLISGNDENISIKAGSKTFDFSAETGTLTAADMETAGGKKLSGMLLYRSGWLSGLEIPNSQNAQFDIEFEPFPNNVILVIPVVRGGISFRTWINGMTNGKAEIIAINPNSGTLTNRNISWIAIGY